MSKSDEETDVFTIHGEYFRDKPLCTQSRGTSKTAAEDAHALKKEVEHIRVSLDVLKDTLVLQQYVLARDFETNIRHVYDGVINDIDGIRKRVNDIGDTFESETKFKTWTPLMPFRKDVLQSLYKVKSPHGSKLKGSKSVDFVDKSGRESDKSAEIDFDKFHSKTLFSQRQSWLGSSQCSISSSCSSRRMVPGFGCCFGGDGKTIPYRSHRALHRAYSSHRHSWGPSRSGSRSTLDDDDLEDRGSLCGVVTDDWRAKVVPYMWEGWPVPGIDRLDIGKLRERMEQMETMRHDIVHVHNEYRRQHGCPDLSVTTDLAKEAQQWSDILALRGYAQYSDSQSRGENILVVDIEDSLSGRQIAETWYRESRAYNYKKPRWQRGTSNFTQMVWQSSQFIGVGIAKFPYDNTYVIVAQYQPPGNINTPGKFRRNVPVPIVVNTTEHEVNNASEREVTNNDTLECKVDSTPEYAKINTSKTFDFEFTNNTSDVELINKTPFVPVDVSNTLNQSLAAVNDLLERDKGNTIGRGGAEECVKQKETIFSENSTFVEPIQNSYSDSQTGGDEELSTGQKSADTDMDIIDLSKTLTDEDNDDSPDDSSEDDGDPESTCTIASVSASQASSSCQGFLDKQKFRVEINKDEIKNTDLITSLKDNPDKQSVVREFTNSTKVSSV